MPRFKRSLRRNGHRPEDNGPPMLSHAKRKCRGSLWKRLRGYGQPPTSFQTCTCPTHTMLRKHYAEAMAHQAQLLKQPAPVQMNRTRPARIQLPLVLADMRTHQKNAKAGRA